jgi:SAM-dependent methyltransferase
MRQDDRALFDDALRAARVAAYPAREFVGQESFMSASQIRAVARQAGVVPGVSVLDLCCGVAGPGRMIARELGCTYLGVDSSPGAIRLARRRAADVDCRFDVATIPPVPTGPFDVVMLLETVLAFREKEPLVRGIAAALRAGGRFVFTLEAGAPLTGAERRRMPGSDTVWLVPLPEMLDVLARHGLRVRWQAELTDSHRAVASSLLAAFEGHALEIAGRIGARALDELVTAHRLWRDWLRVGRVRKYAVVAEKEEDGPH